MIVTSMTRAKAKLGELVRMVADGDVCFVMRHGTPRAVLLSSDSYSAMLDEIAELKEQLAKTDSRRPAVVLSGDAR